MAKVTPKRLRFKKSFWAVNPAKLKKSFVKRSRIRHGSRYKYNKVDYTKHSNALPSYKNGITGYKVCITCADHGEFYQSYSNHVDRGAGCPKCARLLVGQKRSQHKMSEADYLRELIEIGKKKHKSKYTYDLVKYAPDKRKDQKVEIRCNSHGSFWQSIHTHRAGHGCPKCARELNSKTGKMYSTAKEYLHHFLEKAEEVHGDKFDYSQVKFDKDNPRWGNKIKLVCSQGHSFKQCAHHHINLMQGCPKCLMRGYTSKELTTIFLKEAKRIYGNKYDYSKVRYTTRKSSEKIKIVCPTHGVFLRNYHTFLSIRRGCPSCSQHASSAEDILVNWIKKISDSKVRRHVKGICKSTLTGYPLEVDIVVGDVALEYGGVYWHSTLAGKHKNYHRDKYLQCKSKNLTLLTIFDSDLKKRPIAVKNRIRNALLANKYKVFARDTHVVELTSKRAKDFCDRYHTQGHVNAKYYYGLYLGTKLMSVMTFGASRYGKYDYEMIRFCSRSNHTVIGGMSKLFAYFVRKHKPNTVVSYCDLRWGVGSSYLNLGFSFVKENPPSPTYISPSKQLFHRSKVMKHKLKKLLPKFNSKKTQDENLFANGWDQLYDCGQATYVWRK